MRNTLMVGLVVMLAAMMPARAASPEPLVEFEMMTWPEVKAALASGKTMALIYTGGTEQRGPQDVNGGHTLMGRATVKAIAEKLGNAIAMPVLPYTPNNAAADMPGTMGITNDLLAAMLERLSEQAIATGFKTVILMGDHGDGQEPGPGNVYQAAAKKLDAKYAPRGIHIYYCDQVYAPANADFDKYLEANGLSVQRAWRHPRHIGDAVSGRRWAWVRKNLIANAVGDPMLAPGQKPDPKAHLINNGIIGDGRRASAELGKIYFDMKVDYAVKQIKALTAH